VENKLAEGVEAVREEADPPSLTHLQTAVAKRVDHLAPEGAPEFRWIHPESNAVQPL